TAEQMCEYHRQRYTTDNMYLIASGRVDAAQLLDYVSEACRDWPKRKMTLAPQQPPQFNFETEVIERESTHQYYAVQVWPGVDYNHAERYALRLLCSILADDSGSRFFWELIDTGRAETAAIWPQMFTDCGCLLGDLCCAPEDAEENEEIQRRVIAQFLKDGVTEKEIELARNKIASALILSDERPGNRLFALGQSWIYRRSYEPIDVVLSRYAAVTADDIMAIADRTLRLPSTLVKVVGGSDNE
ncbi:MAG: insulinase family protein, partial [Planctomycetales bacterium]|nr:insulinase family protein [Planctomycetales bacterium]